LDWNILIIALGLALFMEGVAYALIPERMKALLIAMLEQPAAKLRGVGLTIAAFGVAIVWLMQGTF
jgi:uncharacterized protein YjeT (DUF2065 family)